MPMPKRSASALHPSGVETPAAIRGRCVTPGGILDDGCLVIRHGLLESVGPWRADRSPPPEDCLTVDGWILPGLIDTHIHGSNGDDVMLHGVAGLRRIAQDLLRYGVTGWLPSTISASPADLRRVVDECLEIAAGPQTGAQVLGIHVEGPFINRRKKGAQPEEGIRDPDLAEARALLDAAGDRVKVMTLAPELPRAFDLIHLLRDRGVIASLGHSEADYATGSAAVQAGASHATHLFNAMPPLHHREPGLAACCLNAPEVAAEIIADGVHVHPEMVRLAVQAGGPHRTVLVTDAMSAVGRPDGIYTLGPHRVHVRGDRCTLDDGTIASSMLTMDGAVRNVMRFAGSGWVDTAQMASQAPAQICGLGSRKGSLEAGKDADLTILDEELRVCATLVGGRILYRRAEGAPTARNSSETDPSPPS